jgi:nucleotide-binding universal stress UspA family protein
MEEKDSMYKRILVPVDGSDTSNKALLAAVQMATDAGAGARLRVVHVTDESAWLSGYDAYGGASEQIFAALRENGTRVLDDAMALAHAAGIEADQQLFDQLGERLGETVASAAAQWHADLIVVGTHGRHGVGRVLMGSGAEQVIRQAPVPVLVIRQAEVASGKPQKQTSAAISP